ncbi:peroxiredoxin family protein [Flavobacterium sp. RS13.1]|jgi:cytochrome oxidase Cu insertion factor (SCO1/SenC/PrrC family)|uniref:peroxiredoxin family protein n=1 Tax=Flavobacterium sp. RS13.1 TaxID=3400345 RepID=UPI003AAE68F1
MNKILALFAILLLLISCQNRKEQEENNLKRLQKQAQELMKNQIDFFMNATPKYFSAETLSGKRFNSQDFKNKNLVVFIYDKSYLKKSDTYDMTKELNEIYNAYKDKIEFIGIIEGYVENQNELDEYLKKSKILFEQIDNTISQDKPEILNYNMYCSPAKILIDPSGKVIHSSCGGGNSYELIQKLESIKNSR